MKRITSILLILALVLSSVCAFGAESESKSGEPCRVYCNQDFENIEDMIIPGFNLVKYDNVFEIKNEGENSYLVFKQDNAQNNMHMDMNLPQTSKSVVIELDFRIVTPGMSVALMNVGDYETYDNDITDNLFSFAGEEMKYTARKGKGETSYKAQMGNLAQNQWFHISAVLNLDSGFYDLWLDEEKKANGAKIVCNKEGTDFKPFNNFSFFRIMADAKNSGEINIDNIKIYDGEVRDISGETVTREPIFEDDFLAKEFLKDKRAINPYTCLEYINGEKKPIGDAPVTDGEKIYISQSTIFDFLGEVEGLEEVSKITKDGKDMYLLSEVCEKSPRYIYNDDHGCFISAESEFEASSKTLKKANYLVSFVRPSTERIKADLTNKNGENLNAHPRIVATADDFSKLKEEVKTGRKKEWFDAILQQAQALETVLPVAYEKPDGLRILTVSEEFKRRMEILGFCRQITGEQKYFDRALQEINAVIAFPDWNAKDHFLDVGPLATGLAVAYDWFYDDLSAEKKEEIFNCAKTNCFLQYYNAVYGNLNGDASFVQTTTNHSPTINCGVIELAAALCEHDPSFCSEIISYALRSLEYAWYCFAPDGAWHEGPGYWYGTIRDSGRLLASLNTAFGTDYNLCGYKGLDEFTFFVSNITGSTGNTYNFHDSGAGQTSRAEMFWFAKHFGDPSAAALRLDYINNDADFSPEIYDIIWCDNSFSGENAVSISRDKLYKGLEMVLMRSGFNDKNATFLAYHGAETQGGHNHCDAGSFVYEIDGVRWAVDLGVENQCYNDSYSNRLKYYRIRAEGHNSVVINPSEASGQDADGYAPITRYETSDEGGISAIDLSSDYKESANSYERGFMLSGNRRVLTVRDEISLKETSEMYWFMHTSAQVQIVDNNTAVLTSGEKALKVEFLVEGAESQELCVMNAEPLSTSPNPSGQTENTGKRKLALKIDGDGEVNITARLSAVADDVCNSVCSLPISSWKLESITEPKVSYSNGEFVAEASAAVQTSENQKAVLVLAVYNGEVLENAAVSEEKDLKNAEFSVSIKAPADRAAKAFLWNGLEGLVPLKK